METKRTPRYCAQEIETLIRAVLNASHPASLVGKSASCLAYVEACRDALNAAIDAKLEEATATLVEALRFKEFDQSLGDSDEPDWCSDCTQYTPGPHTPECPTGNALAPYTQPTPEPSTEVVDRIWDEMKGEIAAAVLDVPASQPTEGDA